jgi:hypothetical protein
MKTEITHENFDYEFEKVRAGQSMFYIPTYTRCTVINAKTIEKFSKLGLSVIKKSADGKGFRMASGRSTVYVLPGQLIAK